MEVLTIIVTILLVLCGLAVILAVLFQSGKSAGLSDVYKRQAVLRAAQEQRGG